MALEGQKVGHTAAAVVRAASKNRFNTGGLSTKPTFTEEVEKEAIGTESLATKALNTFISNPSSANAAFAVRSLQTARERGEKVTVAEQTLAQAIDQANLDPTVSNQIFKLAKEAQQRVSKIRKDVNEEQDALTASLMAKRKKLPISSPFEKSYAQVITDAINEHRQKQQIEVS
jgi:hypothetical protein